MASDVRKRGTASLLLQHPGAPVVQCRLDADNKVSELREYAREHIPALQRFKTVTLIVRGVQLLDDDELIGDAVGDASFVIVGPPRQSVLRKVFKRVGLDTVGERNNPDERDAVEQDLMDNNEDLRGQHVSQRQHEIGEWLKMRCRVPSAVLSIFYLLSLRTWGAVLVWMWWARVANGYGFGALYVGVSMILLMVFNLGRRKPGEASAYSLFNEGIRRLPGDFTEDQIDNAFRGRM